MAENTPCLRRWWARSATSPNQLGVEGMHWEDVWIVTAESVILFMSVSLLGTSCFFLIKETHSYACSLLVTSRCAIRGYHERWEIEIVVDEIKTHLRVQQKVLRSHTPEGVRKAALRAVPGAFCHPRLDVSLGPASGSRPRSCEFYGGDLSALRSGGRVARRARASHAAVAH